MTVYAKLTVSEEDGVRRFLYPMIVEIPFKKNETLMVAVKDDFGNMLPSEAYLVRNKAVIHFAASLDPYERRKLTIFRSELKAPVPDPILSECLDDGRTTHRQERLQTTILKNGNLGSVVYDDIEHLAGHVAFTVNAEAPDDEVVRSKSVGRQMSFQTSTKRYYPVNDRFCQTDTRLTACKSWVELEHTIDMPAAGSVISLDIPLSPPDDTEIPVCDFGLGNGVYAKIDGDAVMLEADFYGKKPYCCWQVSRLTEGIQRIDYLGNAVTMKTLANTFYFHWTSQKRSLAVVMTQLPSTCTHFQAILGRTGHIHISVVLGEEPVKRATLGAILHFLNDIPAIAAATNPASIISPPKVSMRL